MGSEAGTAWSRSGNVSQPRRPATSRWLNLLLVSLAFMGWMIFVMACVGGPAWSPDGSKILFGYYDEEHTRTEIAIYDVAKHKTRVVFRQMMPEEKGKKEDKASKDSFFKTSEDGFLLVPIWQADGSHALITMSTITETDDPSCVLLSISIKPDDPVQMFNFGTKATCYESATMPRIGGRVYLGSKSGLSWIDPLTGEMNQKDIDGGVGLIGEQNGKLMYDREIKRPAPTAVDKDATETGLEFGEVDLSTNELKPAFTLFGADLDGLSSDSLALPAWEPNGSRIAMVGEGKERDQIVWLDAKKGITGKFTPELGVTLFRLGAITWSPDRKMLYVPTVTKGEKETEYIYSLAEIPVAGTPGHLTRIAKFDSERLDREDIFNLVNFGLQVSVSPDGKTVAASTASLRGDVAPGDRGLFLIDVAHPERRITRILPPKSKAN